MRKFSVKMLCACNPKLIDVERNLARPRYMELIREGLAELPRRRTRDNPPTVPIVSSCVSKLAMVQP
ncbi:hypothetical protein [Vibrio phage J14]|nr:hypothetical protein [Vibrio phage J14]